MRDRTREAEKRWKRCEVISDAARFQGLNASPELVNKHYKRFSAWYEGRLATGYLIKTTGIQKLRTEC